MRIIEHKNKLPHNAVHLQGIEPACAGGCLTASRKSPLEGGWFLKGATSYYVSGIPVDLVHATATVLFLWLAAEPMLEKLDRIKVKYGMIS